MKINLLSSSILLASLILVGCQQPKEIEKNSLTASAPAGEASTLTEKNTLTRLQSTLEQHFKTANLPIKILEIKPIPHSPFYWVRLDNHSSVYTTADGQFLIEGHLFHLGGKSIENMGDSFQAEINKKALSSLNEKDLIIYPATGKKQHTIYVFTDVSCGYCQRLHHNIADINAKGIEVRYIAWPRGEQFLPAMESIWCSADRKKAFDAAMAGQGGQSPAPANCENPVKHQFQLGEQLGVSGTPAIFTEDGRQIGGYLEVNDLLKALSPQS